MGEGEPGSGSFPPDVPVALAGHRGARALWPENTLPGFLGALQVGATVLELDLHVALDGVPVVCHDPQIRVGSARVAVASRPSAFWAGVDVGSMPDARFPVRRNVASGVPTLEAVFEAVSGAGHDPGWLLEIKSTPRGDGRLHPAPGEFAEAVDRVVRNAGLADRVIVISFDPRVLVAAHGAGLSTGLLLEAGSLPDPERHVAALGYRPTSVGPHHSLVDAGFVGSARRAGLLVIPWTVNEEPEMERLLHLGVDGITTDRPDLAVPVFDRILGPRWTRPPS